jgi:hypothetical protein
MFGLLPVKELKLGCKAAMHGWKHFFPESGTQSPPNYVVEGEAIGFRPFSPLSSPTLSLLH